MEKTIGKLVRDLDDSDFIEFTKELKAIWIWPP